MIPGTAIPITDFISETASEHVCRLVPMASPQMTARELRQSLEGAHFESATHVGVCDDGKLIGVLRVEELFGALAMQRSARSWILTLLSLRPASIRKRPPGKRCSMAKARWRWLTAKDSL